MAVGFLVGMLIPRTQMEDQRLGELSDQVKEQARDVGREALDQGRDLAAEVGQRATEVAREGAKEHGQQLAESARESVQSLTEESGSQPGQEANSGLAIWTAFQSAVHVNRFGLMSQRHPGSCFSR